MTQGSRDDIRQVALGDKDLFFEKPTFPQLYVFFSFDLVNSTIYKNKQKEKWPIVFAQFYQIIREEMKKEFQGIKVWKYIGDEVLFFKMLNSNEELFEIVHGSFKALTFTLEKLKNSFPDIFKPLSLKGTIWEAPVMPVIGEELEKLEMEKTQNIALDVVYENQASLRDFMGPDIDIGFRISKYAEKEKLVISADLAYMLLKAHPPNKETKKKKNDLLQNLKIVSYEDLKGIWNDRYYPVIWYYKNWGKIKDTFEYDDRFKSKIINNVCLDQFDDLEELAKIFQQLNLKDEKDSILKILKESEKSAKEKAKEKAGKRIPVLTSDERR